MARLTDIVKHLLIINILFFVAKMILVSRGINLDIYLSLFFPKSSLHYPWQYLTHMFMHADVRHLLFNMLSLFFFGPTVESILGSRKFLFFYLFSGLGAVLLHLGVNYIEYISLVESLSNVQDLNTVITEGANLYFNEGKNWTDPGLGNLNQFLSTPVLGASGAVFGIYAAAALLFGDQELHLYFLIPVKIKYAVVGFVIYDLYRGLSGTGGNIAVFAHIGGALAGFIMIMYWKRTQFDKNRWD